MLLGKIGGWFKEMVGEDHSNPLIGLMNDASLSDGGNNDRDTLLGLSPLALEEGEEGDEESYESDLDDYIVADDDDDIENAQYFATPEEARRAFVKSCNDFIELKTGRCALHDTDLLVNCIRQEDVILLPTDHPLVNMLMQDSDTHPGDEQYDPIDEIDSKAGIFYVYLWQTVETAVSAVVEMFELEQQKLEQTWIFSYTTLDEKEEQHGQENINIVIE